MTSILDGLTAELTEAAGYPRETQYVTVGIDDGLTYDEGRAAGARTVTKSGPDHWGCSQSHTYGTTVWDLQVYRFKDAEPNEWGGMGKLYNHPELDGLTFDNEDDGWRTAYNAGILRFFFWRSA